MKVNLNRKGIVLLVLLSFAFILPNFSFAKANPADYLIQGLSVSDVPDDDGSGLVVSWNPLSKDKRVIEYRVYRGVNPDALFYVGKIDVNLKTGVTGDSVYFYDSGWLPFVDLESPAKLKKEKGKHPDRSIFRKYPRDMEVNGPELRDNYVVLGIAQEKEYYYEAEKVEKTDDDGETEVYSGLKLNQFDTMYKILKVDKEYYYTVLAVDEARHYYEEAEPVMGIPRANSPEAPKELASVFVEDQNSLQFEWKLPIESGAVYGYEIWMLKKGNETTFNNFVNEQKLIEGDELKSLSDEAYVIREAQFENPAFQIYRSETSIYTDVTQGIVNIIDGKIAYDGDDYEIGAADLENYHFLFAYQGRQHRSWSDFSEVSRCQSSDLPAIERIDENHLFTVKDRIEDKGDYNTISWGKPVATITNTSYLNDDKTELLVNYEYYTNEEYDIKNIYFVIYDEADNEIQKINEFYPDKKLIVELPEGSDPKQDLHIDITFKCNRDLGDYIIGQDLSYNDFTRSLAPANTLFINGVDVSDYHYYIYKRNYTDQVFRLAKKIGATQREYNDNIRHENNFSLLVGDFDTELNRYLVNPSFSVYRPEGEIEAERARSISGNIWRSEAEKQLVNLKSSIERYTTMADTISEDQKQDVIDHVAGLQEQYDDMLASPDPILAEAKSITDDHQRLKFLYNQRDTAKRSFEYKLAISDGNGHFIFSDIFVNTEISEEKVNKNHAFFAGVGINHFYPRSNWFKWKMFPALIATLIFGSLVFVMIRKARTSELYIRPIAGIQEIDNAIGRATEMGRPILFVPGLSGISDVATLAGLSILGRVAKKAAEYDTKILCPVRDYIVLPIAQEIIKEAHYEAGRPDSYDKNSAFFITTAQFAFVAGVNGIMLREKTATNFYMGMFWAEALIMTETGSGTGAIQIAGTDAVTQIPFFITTCDYTLIGEELYAASAYLAREPLMLGTLKGQDYMKLLIIVFIIIGTVLSTAQLTFFINAFPEK